MAPVPLFPPTPHSLYFKFTHAAAAFFAMRAASRRPVPQVTRFFFFSSFHCLRERVFLAPPRSDEISRWRGSTFLASAQMKAGRAGERGTQ